MPQILAVIGLVAFAVQLGMLAALSTAGKKEDVPIVVAVGLVAELSFVVLALTVVF